MVTTKAKNTKTNKKVGPGPVNQYAHRVKNLLKHYYIMYFTWNYKDIYFFHGGNFIVLSLNIIYN